MKILKKLFKLTLNQNVFIRDICFLVILTRLLFLENNQIIACFELMIGLLVYCMKTSLNDQDQDQEEPL